MDKPLQRKHSSGKVIITSHLVSDVSVEELHTFVASIGGSIKGFHDKPGQPHYDLIAPYIERALQAGAKLVPAKEIIRILKRYDSTK